MNSPILVRRFVFLAVCLTGLSLFGSASAQVSGRETPGVGTVAGRVLDAKTGEPLAFANISILGTKWGAITDANGNFIIKLVPVGTYTLKASFIGYDSANRGSVLVNAGQTMSVDFRLSESMSATTLQEIVVTGQHEVIQKESSSTRTRVTSESLETLPVNNLTEAISLKAGVVAQAGQLHFRGGRSGEVQYQIDGVPVTDPLNQGGAVNLALNAVSESEQLLGGLDAEYGNAQSGVVNITTKEGGDRFGGEASFLTDDYGAPNKTYDNFDRVSLGFGGPTMVKNLTYFTSLEGTYQDGYLKTAERRSTYRLLDFIKLGDRQSNDIKIQSKLSYRPGPNYKVTFEFINNHTRYDRYEHVFSRVGYVSTRIDTLQNGGIETRFGDFHERPLADRRDARGRLIFDTYYNAAEHTPNYTNDFKQFKLVYNHTLSPTTFYTAKLSRNDFLYLSQVQGKQPWEYTTRFPNQWRDLINFETVKFFATNGDMPTYTDRRSHVYNLKLDWTSKLGAHKVKVGGEGIYNDLSLYAIDYPLNPSADGLIGSFRSKYHYYSPEGSFYVQDSWEHEGMILNLGARYDAFSVGNQLDTSEIAKRVKSQVSPRVGIAYPISDRDVFSFHYGRFSQVPDRRYLFEDRGFSVRTRGNPNLENETTVSYQASIQHIFSPDLFGQFSVYFKDIFGLLAVVQAQSGDNPNLVNTYVNKDYASSRGFEVSLTKRFSHHFGGELSYTYGIATGVASDPNQQANSNFLYLPIAEQALDWDQRHTMNASLFVSESDSWGANFLWSFGTGFPYTPISRNERKRDPAITNSRRLPSTTTLDLQAEKYYKIWGQRVKFFTQGKNLLDASNIFDLAPGQFPTPLGTNIDDYEIYYTETGRAGGAYLDVDRNADGVEDWVALNDPRVFGEGRVLRVGVGVTF